ncbi:MAG TPA: hypothetical protein VGR02_16725 [Thermoanaerobaculia bacterium]|jgi:hypothetical protein|nr:hypothetical protein [Thermoanaerobaculia bacterium]
MKLLVALLLAVPLLANEPCRPKTLNLPLSVADHELWGKGLIRKAPELAIRDLGCEGVWIDDFVTSAETAGHARVRVTFAFTVTNESAVAKKTQFRISIVLLDGEEKEREISARISTGFAAGGGTDDPITASILVPEADLRLPPAPTLRVQMLVEDGD